MKAGSGLDLYRRKTRYLWELWALDQRKEPTIDQHRRAQDLRERLIPQLDDALGIINARAEENRIEIRIARQKWDEKYNMAQYCA